jgi:hypothetical protein
MVVEHDDGDGDCSFVGPQLLAAGTYTVEVSHWSFGVGSDYYVDLRIQ